MEQPEKIAEILGADGNNEMRRSLRVIADIGKDVMQSIKKFIYRDPAR